MRGEFKLADDSWKFLQVIFRLNQGASSNSDRDWVHVRSINRCTEALCPADHHSPKQSQAGSSEDTCSLKRELDYFDTSILSSRCLHSDSLKQEQF